jgi:hypothetical protein
VRGARWIRIHTQIILYEVSLRSCSIQAGFVGCGIFWFLYRLIIYQKSAEEQVGGRGRGAGVRWEREPVGEEAKRTFCTVRPQKLIPAFLYAVINFEKKRAQEVNT